MLTTEKELKINKLLEYIQSTPSDTQEQRRQQQLYTTKLHDLCLPVIKKAHKNATCGLRSKTLKEQYMNDAIVVFLEFSKSFKKKTETFEHRLYKKIHNKINDMRKKYHRRKKLITFEDTTKGDMSQHSGSTLKRPAATLGINVDVHKALGKLSYQEQQVLKRYHIEGDDINEIAVELQVSARTVNRIKRAATEKLQEHLKTYGEQSTRDWYAGDEGPGAGSPTKFTKDNERKPRS